MKAIFLLLILFSLSCSSEVKRSAEPKNLIPRDTFVLVLKDLTKLESYIKQKYPTIQQSHLTSIKSSLKIFDKYNIDSSRFNKAMNYYSSRQLEMQDIYSEIIDSVNRELTELTAK